MVRAQTDPLRAQVMSLSIVVLGGFCQRQTGYRRAELSLARPYTVYSMTPVGLASAWRAGELKSFLDGSGPALCCNFRIWSDAVLFL